MIRHDDINPQYALYTSFAYACILRKKYIIPDTHHAMIAANRLIVGLIFDYIFARYILF